MARKVKITPETEEILRRQRKRFVKKFGREPGPDYPIVFDTDSSNPVSISEEQLRSETLKAMLAAGTPPHFVYAYQKTGFIVDETGYRNMSPEDRAEYDAAIAEYFAMEEAQAKGAKQ